jgi:predicted nucleic acid-binding protein
LIPNDQEDDPVLETALHGRVHVLCTLDRHFQHRAVLENCRKQGIEVLTDAELLIRLRETSRPSSHHE